MVLAFSNVVSGGRSGAVEQRARELQIAHVFQGVEDKCAALGGLLKELGLRPDEAAFMGDDWPDLRVMAMCGYAIAPADAEESVRGAAAFVTMRRGGHGSVREAVEHLLTAKGLLGRARAMYGASA